MVADHSTSNRQTDLLSSPLTAVAWWGLPLVLGWAADFSPLPQMAKALVWSGALAWMGAGCAVNAYRCHRLHCYIAAPILFLGALTVLLIALGVTPLGAQTSSYAINATLGLALISLLVEPIWGKHRTH
jgi:hypothetical protein